MNCVRVNLIKEMSMKLRKKDYLNKVCDIVRFVQVNRAKGIVYEGEAKLTIQRHLNYSALMSGKNPRLCGAERV